jgi:hypothetical protein
LSFIGYYDRMKILKNIFNKKIFSDYVQTNGK